MKNRNNSKKCQNVKKKCYGILMLYENCRSLLSHIIKKLNYQILS